MKFTLIHLFVASIAAFQVDLFTGTNQSGNRHTVEIGRSCVLLPRSSHRHNVRSVDTNDGCLRLCDGYNCDGECITADPRQAGVCRNHADLSQCGFGPNRVVSIIAC